MQVESKAQMYEMLRTGKFGNAVRSWSSYAELVSSDYRGLVGVRSLTPGGAFLAHVPLAQVPEGQYVYSEMQEDSHVVLQGEVYRSVEGLYLFASTLKTHMRPALKEGGKHYWLSAAYAQLETALWPSDYDAIMDLLATYPDSVVEFSAYDREVGILQHRNTIIWEVRNY